MSQTMTAVSATFHSTVRSLALKSPLPGLLSRRSRILRLSLPGTFGRFGRRSSSLSPAALGASKPIDSTANVLQQIIRLRMGVSCLCQGRSRRAAASCPGVATIVGGGRRFGKDYPVDLADAAQAGAI